jgi:hypothetical protein
LYAPGKRTVLGYVRLRATNADLPAGRIALGFAERWDKVECDELVPDQVVPSGYLRRVTEMGLSIESAG